MGEITDAVDAGCDSIFWVISSNSFRRCRSIRRRKWGRIQQLSATRRAFVKFVNRTRAGLNSKLLENMTDVFLYRPPTDPKNCGNLAVPLPFRDPVHDFALTQGETKVGTGGFILRRAQSFLLGAKTHFRSTFSDWKAGRYT